MSNDACLPACTHGNDGTPLEYATVIEFLRLEFPLNYCDGWKNLFSIPENLARLLSQEDDVDGGGSQPRHPLENVLLKRSLAQTPSYPSHVISSRIKNEDLSEEDVRLYQAKEGELGNYVALSYAWGGPQKVTTTHSSIAQHLAAISVKSLGKTIRDAITFVRALGIKYAWVDALCIIQDGDKIDEINNMGSIYPDAWLVIAAEASRGVEHGFLQEWPVRRSPAFDKDLPNGRTGTIVIGAGGLDPLELDGLKEDAAMICSTQTLVSDKTPFGAVLHITITVLARTIFPSAVKERFDWSSTYLYMDYSGDVLAECNIEPSLYMLLGAKESGKSPETIGLALRACKEDSQQCLQGNPCGFRTSSESVS
ncbi:hypothetical protein CMUS01_13949 [Colletotrichum musicola]|uniref:Heterokaryon incompatibility domain-containing protein n=1 Tax=Colletotrichum musicola TaxID=2175873 RepID=A0A8H6J8M9_9PEZI|nr:hypothetical protein CMUS01_13949 [Colletotrichum musicola]